MANPNPNNKKCPGCKKFVKHDVAICGYCGAALTEGGQHAEYDNAEKAAKKSKAKDQPKAESKPEPKPAAGPPDPAADDAGRDAEPSVAHATGTGWFW